MHCELVVPGLLSGNSPGRYASIELLLGRGRRQSSLGSELEPFLMGIFGLEGNNVPAGALTVLAANGDPGGDFWLRADPDHLRLMRDRLVVVPAEALDISREEADALCAALNAHFGDAMRIQAIDARRWTARLECEMKFLEVPAVCAAGQDVAPARNNDAMLTEIQMVLHAHPVNEAREARGEPAVNSLWLWGAGPVPKVNAAWSSVLADEPVAIGLARLANARHGPLPASAAPWLERAPGEGRHLLVLDALRAPAALGDFASYKENLDLLEAAWFAPVLAALRSGRIGMVTVHVPDGEAASAFEIVRGDLRRIWRRARALESLA
jgi:hypothetical protein